MQRILVTFGTPEFYGAMDKLISSCGGVVSGYARVTERSLPRSFYLDRRPVFQAGLRGFGYWSWKPYVIGQVMDKLTEGDQVIYVDSTCLALRNFSPLFDLARERGVVLFDNRDTSPDGSPWRNDMWTKADCFNLMHCNSRQYTKGLQVNASFQVYTVGPKVRQFVDEYTAWCKDPRVITDLPNTTGPNLPKFREHRHDQSVLALMAIKYDIPLEPDPSMHNATAYFNHYRGIRPTHHADFVKTMIG